MDKQKVIKILQKVLDDYSSVTYTGYYAPLLVVAIKEALEELKKPDANDDRIRIKDEAIEEAMKWILCDDIICMLKKAREE